jgi:hypothetical protein
MSNFKHCNEKEAPRIFYKFKLSLKRTTGSFCLQKENGFHQTQSANLFNFPLKSRSEKLRHKLLN